MDITPRKRSKIVTLHEHSSMTQRQIAQECKVSLGAVNKIIHLHLQTGTVSPKRKGHCGRKRKTTSRDDAMIIRNSKIDPRKTSDMLKRDLETAAVFIHSSTVRRRLLERERMARKPL